MNVFIVKQLRQPIKDFVQKEVESGFYLPEDFKTDPAAWLEVLRNIEYSFDELYKEYSGEAVSLINKPQKWKERGDRIQKGFELFGKYLTDLI